MDSLDNILHAKNFDEPSEMAAIKSYVQREFQESVAITVREKDIVISLRSASLASSLRLRLPEIQKVAKTKKRLVFRIG